MIEKFLSPLAKEIWILLNDTDKWNANYWSTNYPEHPSFIFHIDTHIGFWVSDGVFGFTGTNASVDDYYTISPEINTLDKYILWIKVKKVINELRSKKVNNTKKELLQELKTYNTELKTYNTELKTYNTMNKREHNANNC